MEVYEPVVGGFTTRSDTTKDVQPKDMAKGLKFRFRK